MVLYVTKKNKKTKDQKSNPCKIKRAISNVSMLHNKEKNPAEEQRRNTKVESSLVVHVSFLFSGVFVLITIYSLFLFPYRAWITSYLIILDFKFRPKTF